MQNAWSKGQCQNKWVKVLVHSMQNVHFMSTYFFWIFGTRSHSDVPDYEGSNATLLFVWLWTLQGPWTSHNTTFSARPDLNQLFSLLDFSLAIKNRCTKVDIMSLLATMVQFSPPYFRYLVHCKLKIHDCVFPQWHQSFVASRWSSSRKEPVPRFMKELQVRLDHILLFLLFLPETDTSDGHISEGLCRCHVLFIVTVVIIEQ